MTGVDEWKVAGWCHVSPDYCVEFDRTSFVYISMSLSLYCMCGVVVGILKWSRNTCVCKCIWKSDWQSLSFSELEHDVGLRVISGPCLQVHLSGSVWVSQAPVQLPHVCKDPGGGRQAQHGRVQFLPQRRAGEHRSFFPINLIRLV